MEAAKTLSKISQDRWRWIMQGRIEGEKRDYITGINAAKREGLKEGLKEGAKNLYANSTPTKVSRAEAFRHIVIKFFIVQVSF